MNYNYIRHFRLGLLSDWFGFSSVQKALFLMLSRKDSLIALIDAQTSCSAKHCLTKNTDTSIADLPYISRPCSFLGTFFYIISMTTFFFLVVLEVFTHATLNISYVCMRTHSMHYVYMPDWRDVHVLCFLFASSCRNYLQSGSQKVRTPLFFGSNFVKINRCFNFFFTARNSMKFPTTPIQHISPHLKYVSALLCEVWHSNFFHDYESDT